MQEPGAVSFADVETAATRLAGVAVRTPVISVDAINQRCGAEVHLKAECLQRTGAFKFRGGYNALSSLTAQEAAAGVVTMSSGNHARAIGTAAEMLGISAVIVMPSDAPKLKLAATRATGARIVLYDRFTESREAIAEQIRVDEGRTLVPPYDHPEVIAGQGTTALELFDQVSDLDALVVCLGGGGLLAGSSLTAEAVSPGTRMFGVEPEAGDDHRRSRAAGERVTIDVPRTIADGQATQAPGALTWPIANPRVEAFLTVTDDEIVEAMRVLFEDAKLVVEPSGASAFAAVLNGRVPEAARIGVTLSGGNIGPDRFWDLLARARS